MTLDLFDRIDYDVDGLGSLDRGLEEKVHYRVVIYLVYRDL